MPRRSVRGPAATAHPQSVAAADLALLILSAFTIDRPEWSVAELAEALGAYRSRVHRSAATLSARGFLQRGENGRLRLGLKVFELGSVVVAGMDLLRDATGPLERLSRQARATTWLIQRVGDELLDLVKFEPEVALLVTRRVGSRNPLTFGVVGKVYLAHLDDAEVDRLLTAQPLARYTAQSIVSATEYRAELERTRRRGYATSLDEVYPGITGFGAPIWNGAGTLVAAAALAAPTVDVPRQRVPDLAAALLETTADISRQLGYAAPRPLGTPPP